MTDMETHGAQTRAERLITKDFCLLAGANFMMFFAFYALMPILPFYLAATFKAGHSAVGLVLSVYSAACIIVRPIAGYMLDAFRQRPLYLIGYCAFMLVFCGYAVTSLLLLFAALRFLHGLAFGMASVAGTTIVSEVVPQHRLGEGLGYYGLANTLSMCLGPIAGLAMYGSLSCGTVFAILSACCLMGLAMAAGVKVPERVRRTRPRLEPGMLFLANSAWEALALLLVSVPYGMTTAYAASYAAEIKLEGNAGLFFTSMAAGLGLARLLAGKWVDRHGTGKPIICALALAAAAYFALHSVGAMAANDMQTALAVYLSVALLLGLSYGVLHPAFNTLFVRKAPANKRGVATSTFLTSWDLGIGIGIFLGSYIAGDGGGYACSYLNGAYFALTACIVFAVKKRRA